MPANKIDTYIGFALKSRKVVFGLDLLKVQAVKIKVIIADNTLSEKSLREVKFLSGKYKIPLLISEAELNETLHKKNCKTIGITDINLSKAVLANIDGSFYSLSGGKE